MVDVRPASLLLPQSSVFSLLRNDMTVDIYQTSESRFSSYGAISLTKNSANSFVVFG